MIKKRNLLFAAVPVLVLALALFGLFGGAALAQSGDDPETLLEQQRALEAERNSSVEGQVPTFQQGNIYPLFMGVDDTTVPAYTMDPATNISDTAFIGAQVWGGAYDPVGDRVFFNNGTVLYEWPVGGVINQLGTIVDPAGAAQSMVGLAFYNGQLYGTKNIANEAIWAIDTATLVATVFIDYVDADLDCGGVSADPVTGTFYCTNDDSTPYGAGLVIINPDATVTPVTAYPAGETDIDGLAVSPDGFAYLVIDQPGSIYVYDLIGGAYGPPLTNPWTSSEVFSAGAWIGQAALEPSIALSKTVGTDPNACAATSNITVPVGSDVTYCYEVTNTGTVTLTVHDLTDDQIGDILTGLPYTLDPGASVAVTETANIVTDTVNVATWTACNIDGAPTDCTDPAAFDVVTATATANVTVEFVPDIAISKSPDYQEVNNNGIADFTITVTNTGSMALENVTVSDALAPGCDSAVGALAAGATATYNCSDLGSTSSYTNTAVVTSTLPTGAPGPSASDDAFVEVVAPTGVALSGFGPGDSAAAPLWLAALLLLLVAGGALVLRRQDSR